jgi:hypothetical protein
MALMTLAAVIRSPSKMHRKVALTASSNYYQSSAVNNLQVKPVFQHIVEFLVHSTQPQQSDSQPIIPDNGTIKDLCSTILSSFEVYNRYIMFSLSSELLSALKSAIISGSCIEAGNFFIVPTIIT